MGKNKTMGTLLVIVSAVTFGSLPLFSNLAYGEGIPVSTLLFLRFFSASIILWTYIFIKNINFKISKHAFIHLALISIVGYTASSSGLFYSYKYISGSLATMIIYCYPIIVVVHEMINSKNADFKKLFCLLTTSFGLILIVCTGPVKANLIGVILAFISALGYAFFCIGLEEKETQSINSIVISAYVMTFCSIVYLLQCSITKHALFAPNYESLFYAVIIGIVCSIVPTITLYEGVKKIGVGNSVILSSFEPVFVCILGVIFLKEIITFNMVIGGLLIVSSLILLQTPITIHSFRKSRNYN
ncbi:EamA-like transporter family protein [Clostridium acetireducens DSM 10703]|jgi:drug/metabolite transporter (DMT)-like permease|uniref:EamA-like transporter family protein n=1 Tax=Clostridium acetireducens DSM 10703 TaxID=1121290 RepID=A0A1E8EW00_9CLOT|nr:DMT family transporter [Clostridium acetireducens]OFH99433.1 EamA-like transporter family protein [Clostridium acetireducens DSM 10703]